MLPTLDASFAQSFLAEQGIIQESTPIELTTLGGGVSNRVLMAETPSSCFVLKQPRANLAVEDDWPADVARVHNEASATRAYRSILENTSTVSVPAVLAECEQTHVVCFECAPAEARSWKQTLLDGAVDPAIAETLGRAIGVVHDAARGEESLRSAFTNQRPFEQLRLSPYHRTVAERHPAVASAINQEIERIERVQETLVHGDYSPKNVLVTPAYPAESSVWVLDFEVAHWGDPAFDVAFMLNHLFIKSVYLPTAMKSFHDAARAFWNGYTDTGFAREDHVLRELGILLLARVDGKSPVEYVTDPSMKDQLRSIATESITTDLETIDAFASLVAVEVGQS